MTRFVRLFLQVGLGVAVSIACVILVLNAVDIRSVVGLVSRAAGILVVFGVAATIVDVLLRAIRWRVLLSGLASIPLRRVTAYMLIGYLANNVLPGRAGELIRSHYVGDREGVSRTSALGTVLVERVLDATALLAICAASWLVGGQADGLGGLLAVAAVVVILALIVTFAMAMLPIRTTAALKLALRAPKVAATGAKLRTGIRRAAQRGSLRVAVVLTLVAWLTTTAVFGAAAMAIGLEITLPQLFLIASATNLATAIPSAPGYVGTFELAVVATGSAIGVAVAPALAMGILVHAAILLTTTAAGLVALYRVSITRPSTQPWRISSPDSTSPIREG